VVPFSCWPIRDGQIEQLEASFLAPQLRPQYRNYLGP
jgi:hypothetical protein